MPRQNKPDPVDELYLQELMAGTAREEPAAAIPSPAPDASNEASRIRHPMRRGEEDYSNLFLHPRPCENRQGVYIDRELHAKISVIIGIIGKRNLTVGNYIDNVLAHHFEQFGEDIKRFCSKRYTKLF